jgi:hypothetical protein
MQVSPHRVDMDAIRAVKVSRCKLNLVTGRPLKFSLVFDKLPGNIRDENGRVQLDDWFVLLLKCNVRHFFFLGPLNSKRIIAGLEMSKFIGKIF